MLTHDQRRKVLETIYVNICQNDPDINKNELFKSYAVTLERRIFELSNDDLVFYQSTVAHLIRYWPKIYQKYDAHHILTLDLLDYTKFDPDYFKPEIERIEREIESSKIQIQVSTDSECSKCHKRYATRVFNQTRSGDEAKTAGYRCLVCGNKWHVSG